MMAIFDFTESTWVEIIWYVPVEDADLLGCLFREPADGPWQLRFRTRVYDDTDRVWDDNDSKHVFDVTATRLDDPAAVKAEFISAADRIAENTATAKGGGVVHRLVVRGHAKKALKMLSRQPWSHEKQIIFPKTSDRVQ
jgi:hypothetical protein